MECRKYQKRGYQQSAVDAVEGAWERGLSSKALSDRSVLLVAPTGSGKTLMGAWCMNGRRTLWAEHTRELVLQTAKVLRAVYGDEHVSTVLGGRSEDPARRIQVGTVQTLINDPKLVESLKAELLVIDETHHYRADEWELLIYYARARFVLGLTATPDRSDLRKLNQIFGHCHVAVQRAELIDAKLLVPTRLYGPSKPDGARASDLAVHPVEAWSECAEGCKTIVYCLTVKVAEEIAREFRAHKVSAEAISGETPAEVRVDLMKRFASGDITVLCNDRLLGEGVDVPNARVVILARNFAYWGTYMQYVGRVGRPAPDKPDGIVIDLCGASLVHGNPDADLKYDHGGKEPDEEKGSDGDDESNGPGGHATMQEVVDGELILLSRGAMAPDAPPPKSVKLAEPLYRTEQAREVAYAATKDPKLREFLRRQLRGLDGVVSNEKKEKKGK